METYNGELISELGVKRYLNGYKSQQFSNIQLFRNVKDQERRWKSKECFGCHGTSYRAIRKQSTWNDTLKLIHSVSPFAAGVTDGLHHQTIGQANLLGSGAERTAEGLHLLGAEKFANVGAENWAAADLIQTTFTKLINTDINFMDNPLMQSVTLIIDRYISAIPEWVIEDMLQKGVLAFPEGFEKHKYDLLVAAKNGVVTALESDEVQKVQSAVSGGTQRFFGKQVGKRLAVIVAAALATTITKKIMSSSVNTMQIKRKLLSIRRAAKSSSGGLGKALIILLKAQGFLGVAARASRQLKKDCPKTWETLRYKMHGADMVYFLVEGIIPEYVDRLSLLEKQPLEFAKVMEALIRDRQSKKILYP